MKSGWPKLAGSVLRKLGISEVDFLNMDIEGADI